MLRALARSKQRGTEPPATEASSYRRREHGCPACLRVPDGAVTGSPGRLVASVMGTRAALTVPYQPACSPEPTLVRKIRYVRLIAYGRSCGSATRRRTDTGKRERGRVVVARVAWARTRGVVMRMPLGASLSRRVAVVLAALAVCSGVLASCGGTWLVFHRDAARTGNDTTEPALLPLHKRVEGGAGWEGVCGTVSGRWARVGGDRERQRVRIGRP